MKCKFLLSTVSFLLLGLTLCLSASAGNVSTDYYVLSAKHGVDLSELIRGPLKLESFTDQRANLNGKQISATKKINISVAELVRDAVAQGFIQGGAKLITDDPAQILSGEVIELHSEEIAANGEQQVQATVRAKLRLQGANGGKTYWQSTVYGRAAVPASEGEDVAVQAALDKFVMALFYDDYFLIQLVD